MTFEDLGREIGRAIDRFVLARAKAEPRAKPAAAAVPASSTASRELDVLRAIQARPRTILEVAADVGVTHVTARRYLVALEAKRKAKRLPQQATGAIGQPPKYWTAI